MSTPSVLFGTLAVCLSYIFHSLHFTVIGDIVETTHKSWKWYTLYCPLLVFIFYLLLFLLVQFFCAYSITLMFWLLSFSNQSYRDC